MIYRDREATLEVATSGRPWSLDGNGRMFRLVSEAKRIGMAYLFDPVLAVHTSLVEPLPHQITAVYQEMLPRQPLRYLLADDPGSGKTIMTGLLSKELQVRGDVHRSMIVCPGNLAEQWQDEMEPPLPSAVRDHDERQARISRTGDWFQRTTWLMSGWTSFSRDESYRRN